jgi:hypothetical protein
MKGESQRSFEGENKNKILNRKAEIKIGTVC